jgi:hypothetical protein
MIGMHPHLTSVLPLGMAVDRLNQEIHTRAGVSVQWAALAYCRQRPSSQAFSLCTLRDG